MQLKREGSVNYTQIQVLTGSDVTGGKALGADMAQVRRSEVPALGACGQAAQVQQGLALVCLCVGVLGMQHRYHLVKVHVVARKAPWHAGQPGPRCSGFLGT